MSDPKRPEPTVPSRDKFDSQLNKDEKSKKKADPTVVVALIGAIGTIVTALINSPALGDLVTRLSAPAPAATSVAAIEATNLLPTDAPALIASPTFATIASTTAPAAYPAVDATSTLAPEPTAANTAPPAANTAPPSSAVSFLQCLATDNWTPFPSNLDPTAKDGCWDLAKWGFTAEKGRLLINHNPAQSQQRGIYISLARNVDIYFTIQIDKFRVRSFDNAFLNFGIVRRESFLPTAGGFFSYSLNQPGASELKVSVSGDSQTTQNLAPVEIGIKQKVALSVRNAQLSVSLNDQPAGTPVSLRDEDQVLWIGYVLPAKGELEVVIADLVIESR